MVNPGSQKNLHANSRFFCFLISSLNFAFIVYKIEQLNRSISKFFSMSTSKENVTKSTLVLFI